MYKVYRTILCVVFVVLIAFPCMALGFEIHFLEEGGFFPIGWSTDNSLFAYGWFVKTEMFSAGSQIQVVIQNLVSDEVLWEDGITWDESSAGEDDDSPAIPATPIEAWELFGGVAEEMFGIFGIEREDVCGFSSYPPVEDDNLRAEMFISEDYKSYEIIAYSSNYGQKKISSGEYPATFDIYVEGYALSQDQSRMAVILHWSSFDYPYPIYTAVGSHVSAGFEDVGL